MSLAFSENCSYKKKEYIAIIVNWHYSILLYQSIQQMAFNAIRVFLSSLRANMELILINFQQKQALAKVFVFLHLISDRKRFLSGLKSCSKSSLSW